MVLLTMTQSVVDGLKKLDDMRDASEPDVETSAGQTSESEPSLCNPAIGQPISHGQIIDLWKRLGAGDASGEYSLEQLLRGSHVYIPPPPPKPEPSEEYKALMARLRREEDERSYQRMINPPPAHEASGNGLADASHAFAEVNRPSGAADIGDDEVTVNEIHRQVTLIINFLVSIAGVAATLWIAARWWSTPSRLFLALGGSLVVAIAEVAVYSGYMWRMEKSKQRQVVAREVKQVVKTWVVGQDSADDGPAQEEYTVLLAEGKDKAIDEGNLRKRHAAGVMEESTNT